ncbi:unnamed protein product, partial [Staurois parvus]
INSLLAPCLCALPGSAQHRSLVRSSHRTSVRGPDHVITDCPISDHYVRNL